ncbi:MAG TPA: transcriptional repressor [Candidatus Ornithospirochaeta stercorigallinarum]|nr:transcriptional repressor [Candidatus Ornithospirochaeta stercorigallinarum]
MKEYNTKQKESLLSFLRENNHASYTADELQKALPEVGKSTMYRLLAHLKDESLVSCSLKGRSRTYSYRKDGCIGHIHLLCRNCGRYIHLSESATEEILRIIASETGFTASKMDTEIKGVCRECLK